MNLYAYVQNDPVNRIDPHGFYGNWCNPYWTGGFELRWDDLSLAQQANVLAPEDTLDEGCRDHDICHGDCRAQNNNVPIDIKHCQNVCDTTLRNYVDNLPHWPGNWNHPPMSAWDFAEAMFNRLIYPAVFTVTPLLPIPALPGEGHDWYDD